MRILHISTSDLRGGAARATGRLHKGLQKQGIESIMFVREKLSVDDSVVKYYYPAGFNKILYKSLKTRIESDFSRYKNTRPSGLEIFSDDRSALKPGMMDQLPQADIYHLHWISGFLDLPHFFRNISRPVVWTLHDMYPFTGGCHYNSGCENYSTFCHRCPQLGSGKVRDLSYQIWKRKQKYLTGFKHPVIVRTNSNWLAEEARKSSLFKDLDLDTIHYGIETDEFIPLDKTACRKSLNIRSDARVILFGAPGINNPRKGFKFLEEAIQFLSSKFPNLFLLSFGSGKMPDDFRIPFLHLGHITDNHILSMIYNCADVFVIPSLEEAFGQTALEAMSCGIPVAGFDTGGIPDMIENGITGLLAVKGDGGSLSDAINGILKLNESDYKIMADHCREKVLNRFTILHQAEKYIRVYQQLLELT